MITSIIAAQSTNRVIGYKGNLPWHLPADFVHFKKTTYGYPIIMGRLTFVSIGRPLPGRANIILTRDKSYEAPFGCKVVHDVGGAFAYAKKQGAKRAFIIGGAQIYNQTLPFVDEMYITQVHADVAGDTFFPVIPLSDWQVVSRVDYSADDRHAYAYSFITYVRRRGG
ncbi:MAG: dihydrofolate reductase [Bacteroidota bacterium]